MSNQFKGTWALILVAFIWGYAFIGVQDALNSGWQPFSLLMIRGLIGGIVLLAFTVKKKWWKDRQLILFGIGLGIFSFFGYAGQTIGQNMSSVSNTAFLTALNVVFVPFFVRLVYRTKVPSIAYVAAFVALIGVGVLSFKNSFSFHIGDFMIIVGSVFFAGQIVYMKKCSKQYDILAITVVQLFTMAIFAFVGKLIFQEPSLPNEGWGGVLYAAILSSAIASVLQMVGLQSVSSTKASIILVQESTIATLLAVLLLNEPFTLQVAIGGCLMIVAVLLVELPSKSQKFDEGMNESHHHGNTMSCLSSQENDDDVIKNLDN